jgi:hypothetical protein
VDKKNGGVASPFSSSKRPLKAFDTMRKLHVKDLGPEGGSGESGGSTVDANRSDNESARKGKKTHLYELEAFLGEMCREDPEEKTATATAEPPFRDNAAYGIDFEREHGALLIATNAEVVAAPPMLGQLASSPHIPLPSSLALAQHKLLNRLARLQSPLSSPTHSTLQRRTHKQNSDAALRRNSGVVTAARRNIPAASPSGGPTVPDVNYSEVREHYLSYKKSPSLGVTAVNDFSRKKVCMFRCGCGCIIYTQLLNFLCLHIYLSIYAYICGILCLHTFLNCMHLHIQIMPSSSMPTLHPLRPPRLDPIPAGRKLP